MQVRALKTFQSRYGFIRNGEIFTAEDHYARDLMTRAMVKELKPDKSAPLAPDRTQVLPGAPLKKDEPTQRPSESASQPEDGQAKPSALSRVARRLRKRTSSTRAPAVKP